MRKFVVLTLASAFIIAAGVLAAQQNRGPAAGSPGTPPPWAYGFASPAGPTAANPPAPAAPAAPAAQPAPDNTQHKLPGSTLSFTLAQVRDGFGPADWFPGDHPSMPD